MDDCIRVVDAREHNLKGINVSIPRHRLTVVTGLSGSGKSSLAFDTLYAEGQRRYVESLSAYARQFLDQLRKPDVARIEGLSPAIAIEQRTASANPRSIVATSTEIHDYLRLLLGSIGRPHCPRCGRTVARESAEQIVDHLMGLPESSRLVLLAPVLRGRVSKPGEALAALRRQGYVRARVDGTIVDLDAVPNLDHGAAHVVDAVVDRLIVSRGMRARLTDSVELALKQGRGRMSALISEARATRDADAATKDLKRTSGKRKIVATEEQTFSERLSCVECDIQFDPLEPRSFSFNSPYGACSGCDGLGTQRVFDEALIVPDPARSLADGAVQPWRRGPRRLIVYYNQLLKGLAAHTGVSLDTPYRDVPETFRTLLMHGSGDEPVEYGSLRGGVRRRLRKPFEGVIPNLVRRLETTDSESVRQRLRGYMRRRTCEVCGGARLRPEVVACTVGNRSIVDITRMTVRDALDFFSQLSLDPHDLHIAGELLREIGKRLRFLVDVGLDYLTLDRESATLSGGETQRIRLASQIGSGLVGVLYVLDEPTIGLHARDGERLLALLRELQARGNTLVVVEHDAMLIRAADHVIDLGPGAGCHGGEVMYEGPPDGMTSNERSLTANYLNGRESIPVPRQRRSPGSQWLRIEGADANNLRDIDVDIPLGLLVCITGVSGSGKSTLIEDVLRRRLMHALQGGPPPSGCRRLTGAEAIDKVIDIDQSPIGRTPRSNPVTYTGAFTAIRTLFAQTAEARLRGYGPGRFSFNVKGGRCEVCKGDGVMRLDMHFLPDVYVTCRQCEGLRYNRETLDIRYAGRSIAEVLNMTVDEALECFEAVPAVAGRMRVMAGVGLGYLKLGQSATTLSGGEAQRLKLSVELSRKATGRTLYVLDEPTTGLHFADTHRLLRVLERLREDGNTIIVIEHNLDVIKTADYVIDLGPEGGERGGTLVAVGTPEAVADAWEVSHTGRYLRTVLGMPGKKSNYRRSLSTATAC